MAYEYETSILDQARARQPQPSAMRLPDWNEAVATQARLNKAIRYYHKTYLSFPVQDRLYDQSPYKGLTLRVIKPGILIFEWSQSSNPTPEVKSITTPEELLALYDEK